MKILAAIAVVIAVGCGACTKNKGKAVPAEVDVEWPDTAGFPPEVKKSGDDGAQPDPPAPDAGASPPAEVPAAPMSTGSGG